MAKKQIKNQTKTLTEGATKKCKTSETQIRKRKRQRILRTLQQALPRKSIYEINSDTNSDRTMRHAGNREHAFSNKDFVQSNTNSRENVPYNDDECYRCKHFLEVPRNLIEPFRENASEFVNRCRSELSFLQAIVLVKSAAPCISAISVERLQQILEKCCARDDDRDRAEDVRTDVRCERSKSPVRETLLVDKNTDSPTMYDLLCITPANSQRTVNAAYSLNESPGFLTQQNWSDYILKKDKKGDFSTKSGVVFKTDKSADMFEDADVPMSPDMFESADVPMSPDTLPSLERSDNTCDLIDTLCNKSLDITEPATSLNIDTSFWERKNPSSFATSESERFTEMIGSVRTPIISVNLSLSDVCNDDLELRNLKTENYSAYSTNIDVVQTHARYSPILSGTFWQRSSSYLTDKLSLDSNVKSLVITESGVSPDIETSSWKQKSANSSFVSVRALITPANLSLSDVCNDLELRNLVTENDSAYSTNIDVLRPQVSYSSPILSEASWKRSINVEAGQKQVADTATLNENTSIHRHNYNLRVRKEKICYACILSSKTTCCHKNSEQKKEEKNKQEQIFSANRLNLTLESNTLDRVLFESLEVILSTLRDERTAEEYATRRHWKDTLQKEAVTAVLNISDIFRTEKKPNAWERQIITTIINTVDETITHIRHTKESTWINRLHIIFELCNSLSICVKMVDHLIMKLMTWFQSLHDASEIQNADTRNLRLLLYVLNIALQKYRTIMPSIEKSRTAINAAINPSKKCHVEKEFEDTGLNLDVLEKQWLNLLKKFAKALQNHFIASEPEPMLYLSTTRILTRYFAP